MVCPLIPPYPVENRILRYCSSNNARFDATKVVKMSDDDSALNTSFPEHRDSIQPSKRSNPLKLFFAWIVIVALVAVFLGVVGELVSEQLRDTPYMDEIFHLRQTSQYCAKNNWKHWDPKITTLPGLYVLATLVFRIGAFMAQPLASIIDLEFSGSEISLPWLTIAENAIESVLDGSSEVLQLLCTNVVLRLFINPACAIVSLLAIGAILAKYQGPSRGIVTHMLRVLVVFSFPLSFFFHFLYYTDTGSLMFILLTLVLLEYGWLRTSAITAAFAVFFRQTNIVWVAFLLVDHLIFRIYGTSSTNKSGITSTSNDTVEKNSENLFVDDLLQLGTVVAPNMITYVLRNFLQLVGQFIFHAAIFLGFVAFLFWNDGITVGDRDAHQATLNLPHPLYFILFCAIFSAPILLLQSGLSIDSLKFIFSFVTKHLRLCLLRPFKHGALAVAFISAIFVAVDKYTTAHPYLLADNRHYTFYIWQRTYQRYSWFKYSMIPIYYAFIWLIASRLQLALSKRMPNSSHAVRSLWILAFFGFTAATLIPSALLEFRYFIVPFTLLLLQLLGNKTSPISLLLLLAFNVAINFVTIRIFLYQPFKWSDRTERTARFMW